MRLLLLSFCLHFTSLAYADEFSDATRVIFEKHCIECHGEKKQKGGIALHKIVTLDDAFKNHKLIDNIIDQVKHGQMPPDDQDALPTKTEVSQLLSALNKVSARVKSGQVPTRAGRVTLRRLNRNE